MSGCENNLLAGSQFNRSCVHFIAAFKAAARLLVLIALCVGAPPAAAQVPPASTAPAVPDNTLALDQAQVAERFKKLEELLLKSAELEADNNPTRAALLQQAAQLGKQAQLNDLLSRAAKNLEQGRLSQAVEDQKTSRENLKRLLELLQSENRQDRVREQSDQIKRWIEETDRLRRLQSSLRGRTEGGQSAEQAAKDQEKLGQKAAEIAKDVTGEEESKASAESSDAEPNDKSDTNKEGKPSDKPSNDKAKDKPPTDDKPEDGKPEGEPSKGDSPAGEKASEDKQSGEKKAGDKQPSDKPPGDKPNESDKGKPEDKAGAGDKQSDKPEDAKPSEQKAGEQKSGDQKAGESKPGDKPSGDSKPQKGSQQSKGAESGEGQSDEQKSGEQKSGEQDEEQQPKDPTQRAAQRLKKAQQKMKEAQEQLEDAQRKGAVEKQREAERELEAAIEELEEILRQLREEEIERSLAALESRLRSMLQMQTKVFEESKRLSEISGSDADRQIEIRASNLSLEERKVLSEGQRALLLLREEGTSAAFPEAMEQVLVDAQSVVERLSKADLGKLTLSIEQEIVSSLEEMIEALAAVQKEQKKRQEQQQQGQSQEGEPGEQPLVDKLAELRLIRTLQVRVNKRTASLSEALKDPNDVVGQAEAEDILDQIRGLAGRQSSIQQVTRDIAVEKNK